MHLRKEAIAAGLLIVFLSLALLPGSVATAGDMPGSKPPGEQSSELKGVPETVEVSQWVDPEGEGPTTYEEWASKQVRVPTRILKDETPTVQNGQEAQASASALPKVLVMVNSGVYPSISEEITQYISDLQADSLTPVFAVGTFATPEELRNFLIGKHDLGVIGTALVGDFPSAWYEMENPSPWGHEEFPCDVFLEDLDGTWTDSDSDGIYDVHADGNGLEMWVGRIKGSGMTYGEATETGLLSNYFRKDHAYRIGEMTLPSQALAYIDDEWVYSTSEISALRLAYPGSQTTVVKDRNTTTASDYLSRITNNGYQWIMLVAHSGKRYHMFRINDVTDWDYVFYYDIKTADPHAFFYNLFCCSAARYTETDCISNWYVMCDTYGLGVVGSTKTVAFFRFDYFYQHVRDGFMLGSSFAQWFNTGDYALGYTDPKCYYGLVVLGDPFLRTFEHNLDVTSIAPDSLGNGTGNKRAAVKISGYRFDPGTRVWIEKRREDNNRLMRKFAKDVVVVDSKNIDCTLNLKSVKPGAWDVVVRNPDRKTAVLTGGLTVNPHPVIDRSTVLFSGTHGTRNLPLTIKGTEFVSGATVKLTKHDLQPIVATIDSFAPKEIKCHVDLNEAEIGTWKVEVRNPDGGVGEPMPRFRVVL